MPLEPSGLVEARATCAALREDVRQAGALMFRTNPTELPEDLAGELKVLEVTVRTLVQSIVAVGVVTEMTWLKRLATALESERIRIERAFLAERGEPTSGRR
jgi:hypothetical protein